MTERLYAEVLCPHNVRLGQIHLPIPESGVAMIVQDFIAHCGACAIERARPRCKRCDGRLDHGRCAQCTADAIDWDATLRSIPHPKP